MKYEVYTKMERSEQFTDFLNEISEDKNRSIHSIHLKGTSPNGVGTWGIIVENREDETEEELKKVSKKKKSE